MLMQAACIPAALEGKDVVARACTGSGKTLAYLLPALHRILGVPQERQRAGWQALVFVPTRELCEQVVPGQHLWCLPGRPASMQYREGVHGMQVAALAAHVACLASGGA